MQDLVSQATMFAAQKHYGQNRKYPNVYGIMEPYIMHPARVAGWVAHYECEFAGSSPTLLAAAWTHDIIEDCDTYIYELVNATSSDVGKLVTELTNPSKYHNNLNRVDRKTMDREHLNTVSHDAKIIKMLDRMDNINSLTNAPVDFALMYIEESELLAEVLKSASNDVYDELFVSLRSAKKYFDKKKKGSIVLSARH